MFLPFFATPCGVCSSERKFQCVDSTLCMREEGGAKLFLAFFRSHRRTSTCDISYRDGASSLARLKFQKITESGSCWSFSTTCSSEGAWALGTDNLVSLSEQPFVGIRVVMVAGCTTPLRMPRKARHLHRE